MPVLILLLLFLLLPSQPAAANSAPAQLEFDHRLLKAEYELARQPQIYFLFDLEGQRVQIKSSGVVAAEFPVSSVRVWGPVAQSGARSLAGKDSLFTPEREKIPVAGEEEKKEGKFDLKALELDDMPTSFRALLDDGTRISVRPAPEGFLSRLWSLPGTLSWYMTRPLISLWNFFRGRTYTEVRLSLPPQEARRLYWSFAEGSKCLIAWPLR